MLQVVGTVLKVGGVATLMMPAVRARRGTAREPRARLARDRSASIDLHGDDGRDGGVLWAYDGWINVTPLAEEIRDPGRNIPRALILGMAVLIAVYLGMTLAYHYVLPMDEVAAANKGERGIEKAVAAVYCRVAAGRFGRASRSRSWSCARRSSRSTATPSPARGRTSPWPATASSRRASAAIHPRFQTPANAVSPRESGRSC